MADTTQPTVKTLIEERKQKLRDQIERCDRVIGSGLADPWRYEELGSYRKELRELEACGSASAFAAGVPVGWRCFHCGDYFADPAAARLHFGVSEEQKPACLIKGAEGGLLRALRDAEDQTALAMQAVHSETTDVHRAFYAAASRHAQALIAAEEAGYERGLHDGMGEWATMPAPEVHGALIRVIRALLTRYDELVEQYRGDQSAAVANQKIATGRCLAIVRREFTKEQWFSASENPTIGGDA